LSKRTTASNFRFDENRPRSSFVRFDIDTSVEAHLGLSKVSQEIVTRGMVSNGSVAPMLMNGAGH
jgi:hypothetical protein